MTIERCHISASVSSSDHLAQSCAAWCLSCFEYRIQPILRDEGRALLGKVRSSVWLTTCEPGKVATVRRRLFPGSLLILWVDALGGPQASVGLEPVAAALDCLHNASLVHDDILDNHNERRRQPTLLSSFGRPFALLGGDGLMAAAFSLLGRLDDSRLAGCLARLGHAVENMVAGQWLDEPATWAKVAAEEREAHWLRVCKGKLALGNAWGSLGTFWTGHDELEADVIGLLERFSVVSQIINDFGDTFGWTGYHELTRDSRPYQHEAHQKPTLPAIWSAARDGTKPELLLAPARAEIARRSAEAVAALSNFDLEPSRRRLMIDFFTAAQLPERWQSIQ